MRKIAVIPGDGIGGGVITEAVKVLEAVIERSGIDMQLNQFEYGADYYLETGSALPEEQVDQFKGSIDAILLGPLGDPRIPEGTHALQILQTLRLELNLYVNYRPIKLLNERYCPLKDKKTDDINFVILQENLEGINAGIGGVFKKGTGDEEFIQQAIVTRRGTEQIVRYSLELARRLGVKNITLCNNRTTDAFKTGLMDQVSEDLQGDFQGIQVNTLPLGDLINSLLRTPEIFNIIVACNTFGDAITYVAAALQGGPGVSAEANLNPGKTCMVRPIHGSLPDLMDKNAANPLASISAAAMMLEHFGLEQEACWVNAAIAYALATQNTTSDLGGRLGTIQVGDFVADQIKKGAH